MSTGQDKRFHPIERSLQLVLLDGAGGIHVFWTHARALSDEGAAPDPVGMSEQRKPLFRPLVSAVQVVALCQSVGDFRFGAGMTLQGSPGSLQSTRRFGVTTCPRIHDRTNRLGSTSVMAIYRQLGA